LHLNPLSIGCFKGDLFPSAISVDLISHLFLLIIHNDPLILAPFFSLSALFILDNLMGLMDLQKNLIATIFITWVCSPLKNSLESQEP
jgi:hypothetical protein